MGSTDFYSQSITDIVEKEMSIPTDVPTLQHVIDRSPASTSSQNHRKQRTESMPVSEAPPRAGEYASASSNASSTPTDDIPIPSLFAYDVGTTFAVHGRKHVASNSTKFAVLHEAFDDPDSPPFDDLNMRKPTVMMITKQTFVLMCIFCLLLPASSSDSYHSGRAIQRWTAGDTTSSTTTKLLPTPTTNANYQLRPTFHARDDAQPFVQRAVEHSIADADVTSATTSVLSTSNVTTRFDPSTATGVIGAGEIISVREQQIAQLTSLLLSSRHSPTTPIYPNSEDKYDENEKYAAVNTGKIIDKIGGQVHACQVMVHQSVWLRYNAHSSTSQIKYCRSTMFVGVCRSSQSDDGSIECIGRQQSPSVHDGSLDCSMCNASGFGSLHESGNTSASTTPNHTDRIPTSVYHSYIGDSSHGGAVPSGTANWSTSTTVPIGDPTNDETDLRPQQQQPAPNERNCDQWGINLCALLTTFNLVCVWWFRLCTTTIYPDSEDKSNARNLDQDSQQERMGAKKRRTMTKQNGCKPTQGPQ